MFFVYSNADTYLKLYLMSCLHFIFVKDIFESCQGTGVILMYLSAVIQILTLTSCCHALQSSHAVSTNTI